MASPKVSPEGKHDDGTFKNLEGQPKKKQRRSPDRYIQNPGVMDNQLLNPLTERSARLHDFCCGSDECEDDYQCCRQ